MTSPVDSYDAVIIGSGFGGSINALRLAEAGLSVLVIERGRRYLPGEFPRDVRDTDALLWRYPDHKTATGLFDFRTFSGISTVVASGVGGGSLIYASIHYRPNPRIFKDRRWPDAFTPGALEPYYARVERALGVEPVPADLQLPKRDAFHLAATALGRPSLDTPQAVSWKVVHGEGEGRTTCQLCCECEFGCNFGAKNTLDFTYLAKAVALGATVASGRLVSHVGPSGDGAWEVYFIDVASGRPGAVRGRRVILAAGTLGSNEILLRSRDMARTLPKLSHRLGVGYSGNGDFLGSIQNATVRLDPRLGPDVTSIMRYDEDPDDPFVLATPTFNQPVMEVLASQGSPPGSARAVRLAAPLWHRLPGLVAWAFGRGLMSKPAKRPRPGAGPADAMTTVFAIGMDNAGGRMTLRHGRLDVAWDYERENRGLIEAQRAAMTDLAREYGGNFAEFPLWALFRRTMTVHNLGGCALSEDADSGVVGIDGQVHGHPGLYVSDGSVIPTAVGCHPVMTISAVSEWIAEQVVEGFTRR